MKRHSHKKPPLQSLLQHIATQKINIGYYTSLACLALMFGYIIAGVFD